MSRWPWWWPIRAHTPRAAARCVEVNYEELPAVHDPREAMQAGAPLVHPGGNVLSHYDLVCGDLAAGLSAADAVVEEEFSVQRISPAYMEPENSLGALQWRRHHQRVGQFAEAV